MPESIGEKAQRLLTSGSIEVLRVRPKTGLVVAECQGDHDVYGLGYDPDLGEWRCSCPARVNPCAHLAALQLVTGNGRYDAPRRPDPEDDARLVRQHLATQDERVHAALDRLAGRR